ncbi:hypothetical protein GCM10022255_057120 [Dactylosporangium darangshiense]|uniref:Cell division protein FtsL n=1 Tax=Dactylosporangium darangshiense TaxID=579108 RepID=A0ABP8DEH9_9ACTN
MNVTTLPASRQRRTQQGAPRSGGRTTGRDAEHNEQQRRDHPTDGATALQPEHETTKPDVTPERHASDTKQASPRLRVAPPAPVSAPRAPFVALVLVLVLSGVIGILVLNTRIAENAFKLDALKTKQSNLDRDEERLRSDLANKESPVTLASRAKQLGLVPSRTPAFLVLPDGTKLEMPGPSK